MLGGLGFIIGFLVPMILAKDTGQEPLVGIFITAPLGVILGAMSGYIYATKQNKSVSD